MRFSLLIFFLICFTNLFSQKLVIGKPAAGIGSLVVFMTRDSLCESSIDKTDIVADSLFLILDEVKCRQFDFFKLLYKGRIYFAKNTQFYKHLNLSEDLANLKLYFPDLNERTEFVITKGKSYLDSISALFIKNKNLKDSLDKVRTDSLLIIEKSKRDSTLKATRVLVDKLGPRRTIISNWQFSSKKYLNDIYDISINVFNPFKKKIKYISFVFYAYNPVDDPAIDFWTKSHIKTVRGVGPIEPLESGAYFFENVYRSSSLSTIKLKTVVVTFFDSTSITISNPIEWDVY